jgi:histidinol-phosphate aminotransferase
MIRINKGFLQDEVENYAKAASHILHEHTELIDCSLGVNPYGISTKVTDHLMEFDLNHINHYPISNDTLKEILLKYWENVILLDKSQVQFTHGAMGACELINKILLNENSNVLGYCPQFTDYLFDVEKCGATFDYVPLLAEENYQFNLNRFISKMDPNFDVIYIDNPNNPTGQVIALEDIESIVTRAQEMDIAVILDEAYGDYMSDLNSAATLVNTYNNLFVIRSFSKAFGMAGLRVGYVVMPKELVGYFEKVMIAFPINSLGQFFTQFVLDDREFIIRSVERIKASNLKIRQTVKRLIILESDDQLPIITLKHPDSSVNLFEEFLKLGILTNSCISYVTMDKNSVRLRVPADIEPVIKAIKTIERQISQA